MERLLLALDEPDLLHVAVIGAAILLFLDLQDVGGALDTGQQIPAIVGVEELRQRLDALDDHQQVVLIAEREDGVDQVMPRALVFQVDFEAVGEEGEQVALIDDQTPQHNQCLCTA